MKGTFQYRPEPFYRVRVYYTFYYTIVELATEKCEIKITVNGRRFNDINATFQEFERALEENVSEKKQEIIMKENARRMKPSKKA